jgi:membrane-associated phospholipid phosphatase
MTGAFAGRTGLRVHRRDRQRLLPGSTRPAIATEPLCPRTTQSPVDAMNWPTVVVLYAAYVAAVAWLRPYGARTRAVATAALVAALLLPALPANDGPWARGTLALLCLLGGYHLAGLLFVTPSPALEAWLAKGDAWLAAQLGVSTLAPSAGTLTRGLELAYLLVYPLLPLGAAALHLAGAGAADARYWTAVLAAGLLSYGTLPWLPSRTPRAIEPSTGGGAIRQVNLALLARFSTGLNTVPSGHAATSTAAAVVIATHVASPALALTFAALAAAIAIATVTGRYHFAADTVAGVALGLVCGALAG